MAESKKAAKAAKTDKTGDKAGKTTKKTKAEEVVDATVVAETPVTEAVDASQTPSEADTTPVDEVVDKEPETVAKAGESAPKPSAKAGKRSAKALKEADEKAAKEERKAAVKAGEEAPAKPKPVVRTRSRLERRAKGYRKSAEAIEAGKTYSLSEALKLARQTSHVKFDATVELHVNLNVDPRQADQNIRDNLVLPAGTGKTVRIAVLTDDAATAKKAGADIAGNDDFLAQLEKGTLNFDILIATPALMPKLGKYARTLGPRGLMPNPKSGTVTTDVAKGVTEAKAGRVEYRVDSTGIVHLGIGKVSFTDNQLLENAQAILASIRANKPGSIKGNYLEAIHVTTSMGPSITVDTASAV